MAAAPAYVYEIVIDDPPPLGLAVLDTLREIAAAIPNPLSAISYQHDGLPAFLMGVLDPVTMNPPSHGPDQTDAPWRSGAAVGKLDGGARNDGEDPARRGNPRRGRYSRGLRREPIRRILTTR